MSLREALHRILSDYPTAKGQPFEANALADFVRHDAEATVEEALGESRKGLLVGGSPGQGNWAAVPWISVFDPVVTTSASRGYYVVYLFHASKPVVFLSLNQGTTAVRNQFGALTRDVLRKRADLMRGWVPEFLRLLPVTEIELGSTTRLPRDYAAGHVLGKMYSMSDLPEELALRTDLQAIIRAYRVLAHRENTDDLELQREAVEEFNLASATSVTEIRKYTFHKRVERNSVAVKQVKEFHGLNCQACGLNFFERYGSIGEGFIEAHHLRAISSLEEGIAVDYDIAEDFAVLCANCHRMIHRSSEPNNLAAFRALVRSRKH